MAASAVAPTLSTHFAPPHLFEATRARKGGNTGGTHTYAIEEHLRGSDRYNGTIHRVAITTPRDTTKPLTLAPYPQTSENAQLNLESAFSIGTALGNDWNALHDDGRSAENPQDRYLPHLVAHVTAPDNQTTGELLAQVISGITSHARLGHAPHITDHDVTLESAVRGVLTGFVVGAILAVGAVAGIVSGISLAAGIAVGAAIGNGIYSHFSLRNSQRRAAEQIVCGGSLLLVVNGAPLIAIVRHPAKLHTPSAPTVTTVALDPLHPSHFDLTTEWRAAPQLRPKHTLHDRHLQTGTAWEMVHRLVDGQLISA